MFSPVLKFTLFERFSEEYLEVSEIMEVNGKKTFGYDNRLFTKELNILKIMPEKSLEKTFPALDIF